MLPIIVIAVSTWVILDPWTKALQKKFEKIANKK